LQYTLIRSDNMYVCSSFTLLIGRILSVTFKDSKHFKHSQTDRVGILITNLGTPEAPEPGALRRYLKQFLSDPRVVEFPRLLWWIVLNCIILRIRPARSAKAYKKVWTEEGSPLAIYTRKQADGLRAEMQKTWGDTLELEWAMRYGEPSVENTIQKMTASGVRKLLVLPLYPQYSATTTGSTFDAVANDFTQRRWIPELRFVTHYHDYPPYIQALATSIRQYWQEHGKAQKMIFSFHGVPQRYLHNGDPYHCQCHKTARLLASELGLGEDEFMTTFQSRFGREPWLKPYTDETMDQLGKEGIESVQVACPGFSSDCLETIEEIAMENRDIFLEAGGKDFQYIPALNDSDVHIQALAQLAHSHLAGWSEALDSSSELRDELARKHCHNRPKTES